MTRSSNEDDPVKGNGPLLVALALGCSLFGGALGYYTTGNQVRENAYREGFAAGKASCTKPSKLEKAAKWLAD